MGQHRLVLTITECMFMVTIATIALTNERAIAKIFVHFCGTFWDPIICIASFRAIPVGFVSYICLQRSPFSEYKGIDW